MANERKPIIILYEQEIADIEEYLDELPHKYSSRLFQYLGALKAVQNVGAPVSVPVAKKAAKKATAKKKR